MRVGTIGTGFIVDRFLNALKLLKSQGGSISCEAVYSRSEQNGRALADRHGVARVYTDLEAFMESPEIDFVYVASPNGLHFMHSRMALLHGKHVICEKSFTSNGREARELTSLAAEKQLFLFEASITLQMPNYIWIQENINKLGRMRLFQGNFSKYSTRYDDYKAGKNPNIFNPDFSGGALMDLNVYNIEAALGLFGKPESVHYFCNKADNGIDLSGTVILTYPDFLCECTAAKDCNANQFVSIHGEDGSFYSPYAPSFFTDVRAEINGRDSVTVNGQLMDQPMYYELEWFLKLFERGDLAECQRWYDMIHLVMDVMDEARRSAGIIFAADCKAQQPLCGKGEFEDGPSE